MATDKSVPEEKVQEHIVNILDTPRSDNWKKELDFAVRSQSEFRNLEALQISLDHSSFYTTLKGAYFDVVTALIDQIVPGHPNAHDLLLFAAEEALEWLPTKRMHGGPKEPPLEIALHRIILKSDQLPEEVRADTIRDLRHFLITHHQGLHLSRGLDGPTLQK